MARSKESLLAKKIREEILAKNSRQALTATGAKSQPASHQDIGERQGKVERLLKEGTSIVHRKLPGDSTKRKYRKVNTKDNIWDFLISMDNRDREDMTPQRILGMGAFGAVFEGRTVYNPYNCREFYAQEEAHEFLKTSDMVEKVKEILDIKDIQIEEAHVFLQSDFMLNKLKKYLGIDEIKPEELAGLYRDLVFEAVHDEALEEAEAMNDREIVELMKTRYKKTAPRGKVCIKLAWLPHGYQRLFKREKIVAGLDHKNLAYIFAVDEVDRPNADKDESKLIMNAQQLIDNAMTPYEFATSGLEQKIDFAVQIGDGLRELHRLGLMHRDFKRSNVIITKDGVSKIIDTGFLKKLDGKQTSITELGAVLGTPHYFPPEQAVGDPIDARADIYAVGATLYECLVGETPNALITTKPEGVVSMLLSNDTLPLMPSQTKGVNLHVDQYIEEKKLPKPEKQRMLQNIDLVMAKLLHRDKNRRYQTVNAYMADLNALKRGEDPPVVNEDLKSREISPQKFTLESFTHYRREFDEELYQDQQKSQMIKERLAGGGIATRYLIKPALRVLKPVGAAAALVGTAAVAGTAALAIAYPDLAKQALDYIMGK
ncbi:serine/threonine protein kinase [Candidatus Woesearchaeota archaeon]|nr:serine/threonine protein kinase [Candidatus Woesearchaeota archaeon]MBW3005523.1 serine/threonine protein kinase [Candidatus Woesearchaeota archaeon]